MRLRQFTSHHRLATPDSPWERLKIGWGTPPILTRHGWLILYHGVSESQERASLDNSYVFGRSDGALPKASARDPLSFG